MKKLLTLLFFICVVFCLYYQFIGEDIPDISFTGHVERLLGEVEGYYKLLQDASDTAKSFASGALIAFDTLSDFKEVVTERMLNLNNFFDDMRDDILGPIKNVMLTTHDWLTDFSLQWAEFQLEFTTWGTDLLSPVTKFVRLIYENLPGWLTG